VGPGFTIGYRFLADEYVPGGLTLTETIPFARALADAGVAYLSVVTGCYDAFGLPDYLDADVKEAFMAPFAHAIREAVPGVPIVAAGRIQTPAVAEALLRDGKADLVGLGRVLLADPLWPRKAGGERPEPIAPCTPNCQLCMKRIKAQKPAYCGRWPLARREAFLARVGG